MEVASEFVSRALGRSISLALAALIIGAWAMTLQVPDDKAEWHHLLYETTVILAFLRVFFVQRADHKDMLATQLKLNELLAAVNGASNKLIKAEEAPEKVLDEIHRAYDDVKENAPSPRQAVSIEQSDAASKLDKSA